MALPTILALAFAFVRHTSTRILDPEEGQASPTNRDFQSVHVNNNQGDDLGERGMDVRVEIDSNDGSEPDKSDSGLHTNEHKRTFNPPNGASLPMRFMSFMFSPSSDDSSVEPNYRNTPLISGIAIPFSILLGIPGLTGHWYIRTQNFDTVETRPNPATLDVGLAIGMTCAVIANICIIVRFCEKKVVTMTLSCILFLSIHDIINIISVMVFGMGHRFNDGFIYSEAFWMTICSTVAAFITNVTLITDFIRTQNFKKSGSGLTHKQRTLMILFIFLFFYIALGSMINSFLLSLSFIDALYFTVTTIETIGFGDIFPNSTGSRIFTCFYAAFGIINITMVIGMIQETMKEGSRIGYLRRLREIRARRQAERRWRSAVIWRLRDKGVPVWVPECNPQRRKSLLAKVMNRIVRATEEIPHSMGRQLGMRLNLEALTRTQLEAAAMEAGVILLPKVVNEGDDHGDDASRIWSISHPVYGANMRREPGGVPQAAADNVNGLVSGASVRNYDEGAESSTTTPSSDDVSKDYLTMVVDTDSEKQTSYLRFALLLFVVFWMVGSAIFSLTEGWSYGTSIYFCFTSFTTIGYGNPAPKTPAGRSVFVVWALLGVGAMSVFISAASEAYSKRYKGMLEKRRNSTQASSQARSLPQAPDLSQIQPQVLPAPQNVRYQSCVPLTSSAGLRHRAMLPPELDVEGSEGEQRPSEKEQNAGISAADTYAHMQHLLEELPRHVLNDTHSLQQYVRYLGKCHADDSSTSAYVNEQLRELLDDVARTEGMKESMEVGDHENLWMLVILSIEKSLMELISVAEGAIAAIDERDRITAAVQKRREDSDK